MHIDLSTYPILAQIDSPLQLRQLTTSTLVALCEELRNYLLNSVRLSSGHLASGLGVVELTVALHCVYQTPFDQLIWDTGHQAYPHKILTGRKEQLTTIRQMGGIHPFPWREESPYDVLSVGHAATSISAALGLAIAAEHEQQGRRIVCVIGDGAITAGMAFEAMNHAGGIHPDLLVILNDNEMSISANVGGLRNCLTRMLSSPIYRELRKNSKRALAHFPPIQELLQRTERQLKGMVAPSTLFEALGFNYIGPTDGHHLEALLPILTNVRQLKGPQLLHITTKKGKGYAPAERDPIAYHAVTAFQPTAEKLPQSSVTTRPSYAQIFGDWLCEMAEQDPRLMAITPAMCEGSGMGRFAQKFPQRYFDVAIAEQHAVTFAAGLAIAGYKPVVAIYSTFLQRAYDQVIHDVALQKLSLLFAIDRCGIVGGDGPTHQGAFDLSFLRCIPHFIIMTPSNENECRQLLYTGYHTPAPCAVRYPRGCGCGAPLQPLACLPIGKGIIRRQGKTLALLNFGTRLLEVLEAAEQLQATVVDMRFVKPLDSSLILEMANHHQALVTIEENTIIGGAGSGVTQLLHHHHYATPVLNIGLPDTFIPCGAPEEIWSALGLDAAGIITQIKYWLASASQCVQAGRDRSAIG